MKGKLVAHHIGLECFYSKTERHMFICITYTNCSILMYKVGRQEYKTQQDKLFLDYLLMLMVFSVCHICFPYVFASVVSVADSVFSYG